MTFVYGPGPIGTVGVAAAKARVGASGTFSLPPAADAQAAEEVGAAAPPAAAAALDGMLALQEAGSKEVRDRHARRHGLALIAALGRLQHALLGAQGEADCLRELAMLAQVVPDAADPDLRRAVRALATRAGVELARRGLPASPA